MLLRFRLFIGFLGLSALLGVILIVRDLPRSSLDTSPFFADSPAKIGGHCVPGGLCTGKEEQTVATTTVVETNATVVRVVDGDTFIARMDSEAGEWKVRMLGMNTPETVDPRKPVQCFGKQASEKLHTMLTGKRVRLIADPQADERDKYQRLLRNIQLEDGTDVNALMIKEGFAYAYLSFPLDPVRKRELKTLEEQARLLKVGLWAPTACPEKT